MLLLDDLTGISQAFMKLLLLLDGVVYSLISYVFQVFVVLAQARVFTEETVRAIADRAYIVVGVAALFLVAFSLLQSLVNPDDLTKGKNSPIKVIKNVLISLVLLGAVPMLFNFAYEAQEVIISSHTLERLILGGDTVGSRVVNCEASKANLGKSGELVYYDEEEENNESNVEAIGAAMSLGIFSSFFQGEGITGTDYYGLNIKPVYSFGILNLGNWVFGNLKNLYNEISNQEETLCTAFNMAQLTGNFGIFLNFSDNTITNDISSKINYTFVVSTIAGFYALYMIVSYCIGLAVRAVRLGYYQVIAPIPILARVVPQGQKIFDNWLKGVLSTFAEVFIRLVTVFFVILMINITLKAPFETFFGNMSIKLPSNLLFPGNISNLLLFGELQNITIRVWLMARVLIILGLLIFAKKAPSFISDMIGVKSGSLKLGIRDQIREAALIGKPVATGMDKALGFLSAGAGAGWSYLKGSFGRERPEGGSFGQAVLTGGISGAAKGGNQFSAGRDAEFKRETGKEGPDSIWGEIERRSKAYTKEQNAKAREAYKQVIVDAEASPGFARAIEEAFTKAMLDPKVQQEKAAFVASARNSYIGKRLDEVDASDNIYLDQIKNSDIYKQMLAGGMDEEKAIREVAKMSNDSTVIEGVNKALSAGYVNEIKNSDLYKQMLANGADEVTAMREIAKASNNSDVIAGVNSVLDDFGRRFDNSHRLEDAEKAFDEHYRIEHDAELRTTASKEFQKIDELYKQAKGVIGDWETSERQKDFKAVVEKMMKDEKEKNGGSAAPKDNSKK